MALGIRSLLWTGDFFGCVMGTLCLHIVFFLYDFYYVGDSVVVFFNIGDVLNFGICFQTLLAHYKQ